MVAILVIIIACSVSKKQSDANSKPVSEHRVNYKDGKYVGTSRSLYTSEPFWGKVHLTIENGLFTSVSFVIRDSALHETFNEDYEKHFQGNPVYILQCRNDWAGVKSYPKKLLKKQRPQAVDCISGATWSYNMFQASLKEALNKED